MTRNARVWRAVLVLVIGIPLWVFVSVSAMDWLKARMTLPGWAEMLCWLALGLLWILPLRRVFLGVAARGSARTRFLDDPP